MKKCYKWEHETSARATHRKTGREIYGIYKDKVISYGIGKNCVINCLRAFKNVKVLIDEEMEHNGIIKLEITEERGE